MSSSSSSRRNVPEYVWVKYGSGRAIEVPTAHCRNVNGLIEVIKAKLSPDLDNVSVARITLHTSNDVNAHALEPDESIADLVTHHHPIGTNARNPLYVKTQIDASTSAHISGELQLLPQEDPVSQFWLRLINSSIEHHTLDLTPATAFGFDSLPSKVYIRDHYAGMYARMQQMGPTHRFIIRGTPGVGKSIFAVYLMYQHRDVGTIVYHPRNSSDIYIFRRENASSTAIVYRCRYDHISVADHLGKPTTLYIVDGRPPRYDGAVHCNCVMITSPNETIENEYGKAGGSALVMPTWTLEELQACRQLAFGGLSEAVVRGLYEKWGGVPRYVLQFANNEGKQSELQGAIDRADFHLIQHAIGLTSMPDTKTVSHRLIHIIPDADYVRTTLYFASEYVAERLFKRSIRANMTDMTRWLEDTEDASPLLGPLRGSLFERIGHMLIAAGGRFECRQLNASGSASQSEPLDLQPATTKIFRNISEVANAPGNAYWIPKIPNFPAVDSMRLPDLFFQYTISSDHPIAAAQLKKVLESLSLLNRPIKLCFVVPERIYHRFRIQRYGRADNLDQPMQRDPEWTSYITQYAVKLKLTQTATQTRLSELAANRDQPDPQPMEL